MNADEYNKLLITFLANERCLYDLSSPLYNNINERHQAYLRIGKQLQDCGASDAQVNRVSDRFQALKRRFFAENRKVQNGAISCWEHYVHLEKLLGPLVDRPVQQKATVQPLNVEPSCSKDENKKALNVVESKKRKAEDVEKPEFAGILDYLSIKLNEMDSQTQKNVIEKLLRVVHNPSISLIEDHHQLPQNIPSANPQWTVPPDQY